MKNALILHSAGNNSQGNWFPWLKHELIIKPGEGHFNLEKGEQYKQLPLVMEIVGANMWEK